MSYLSVKAQRPKPLARRWKNVDVGEIVSLPGNPKMLLCKATGGSCWHFWPGRGPHPEVRANTLVVPMRVELVIHGPDAYEG